MLYGIAVSKSSLIVCLCILLLMYLTTIMKPSVHNQGITIKCCHAIASYWLKLLYITGSGQIGLSPAWTMSHIVCACASACIHTGQGWAMQRCRQQPQSRCACCYMVDYTGVPASQSSSMHMHCCKPIRGASSPQLRLICAATRSSACAASGAILGS